MKITAIIPVALLFLLSSCYYDVEEELYPRAKCDTTNVSFSNDIVPLLQNNCYICHSKSTALGGIVVEGYENVVPLVNNEKLYGALAHEPGYSPMPKGGNKFNQCQLNKIKAWINSGALNN